MNAPLCKLTSFPDTLPRMRREDCKLATDDDHDHNIAVVVVVVAVARAVVVIIIKQISTDVIIDHGFL